MLTSFRHPITSWRLGRLHRCVRAFSTRDQFTNDQVQDKNELQRLLSNKQWMLPHPGAELTAINSSEGATFRVLRDDLSHPVIGGNKRRKLDAIFPQLLAQ